MQFLLANAGLPMIGVQMHILVVALIPVVLFEAFVYRVRLPRTATKSLWGSSIANLISTFIGVPMTWFAMLMIEGLVGGNAWGLHTPLRRIIAVTIQAPLLIPYEEAIHWMVPTASLVLMFPFLIVSAVVESRVLSRFWPDIPRQEVHKAVYLANAVTYAILIAYCGFEIDRALRSHPVDAFSN